MAVAVEFRDIVKTFAGVVANNHINLTVEACEIHCLIGENGAGKSTAMNLLYGMFPQDSGKILLYGTPVTFRNPHEAIRHGIGMVHQEFMLVPSLSVLENIFLGMELTRGGVILDRKTTRRKIESILESMNLSLPLDEMIGRLPIAEQQRVEIVKLLFRGANILILDEPTAVLAPQEVEGLFHIVRALKEQGKTIIFITHKLREVMEISDRITVMRAGEVVGITSPRDATERLLAQMMVGRESLTTLEPTKTEPGEVVLSISDLWSLDNRGYPAVQGLSLQVRKGEVLGIAGVAGNGQHQLAEAIFGLRKVERGTISFKGFPVQNCDPRKLRDLGAAYIPQDRIKVGSTVETSITRNMIMGHHWSSPVALNGIMNYKEANKFTHRVLKEFDVRSPDPGLPFNSLSGGNKQKAIVGRELIEKPDFLLAEDPTRGVDIGATLYIQKRIMEEARSGMAILLISQDLQEVMAMSDRIAVIYRGNIVAEAARGALSEIEIGLFMMRGAAKKSVSVHSETLPGQTPDSSEKVKL
jgi:general nucleoside transport system ATP-binding protein